MTSTTNLKPLIEFVDRRLSAGRREAELLQSFVRCPSKPICSSDSESEGQKGATNKAKNNTRKLQSFRKSGRNPVALLGIGKPSQERNNNNNNNNSSKQRKRASVNGAGPQQGPEELYCDKDRAAAVNTGTKDIKHSLRLKRKQDRSKALQIPTEAEPASFLALGIFQLARNAYKPALDFLTKAVELNPVDREALVARSRCHILMGKPALALEDANSALRLDPNNFKAIYQKGEALYHLGDFEHSLVYFHRGGQQRPDDEYFDLGVKKARHAIETAISDPQLFQMAPGHRCRSAISTVHPHRHRPPSEMGGATSARAQTQNNSRLLGELADDKEYLERLLIDPNLRSFYRNENDEKILECIRNSLEYLNERQEFWRQQLPPCLK